MRMQNRVLWMPFIPYIVLSVVHVVAMFLHNDAIAAPTKLVLMPLLALAVVLNSRHVTRTAALTLLLLAIFFSWLGDGAGTFVPFLPTLPMMLAFFGIAHLAYILLFTRHTSTKRTPRTALILVAWWAGMLVIVGPSTGGLLIAVAAYGLVLGATTVAAARTNLITLIGAVFFLASDTLLAFVLFMAEKMPDTAPGAVMLTYTLGQGLIAYGVLSHLRSRQPAQPENPTPHVRTR